MIELACFDDWTEEDGLPEGSGTSEKIWLRSPDGEKCGLFKFPKTQDWPDGTQTISTEHISEWLAYQLGELLSIPCAKVIIGYRDGRIGCLGELLTSQGVDLVEGVNFIREAFPLYDAQQMFDAETKTYYCLNHILQSTQLHLRSKVWIEMILFDFLIGNADRHHSNWALLKEPDGSYKMCPLYDNGSSLCCYVSDNQLDSLFGLDPAPMKRQTDNGSRSMIRIDGTTKKHPTHKEMAQHVLQKYPRIAFPVAERILVQVTPKWVVEHLAEIPDDILPPIRKRLIACYIEKKLGILTSLIDTERGGTHG